MNRNLNRKKEESRLTEYKHNISTQCPKCKHWVVTKPLGYGICKYCGIKVIDKRITFRDKLRDKMI